jgi:PleD family two-component response regulator
LRAYARDSDILARFGGEEFAILFLATTAEAVCQRADELRRRIGEGKVTIEGQVLRVTASGGVAGALPGDDTAAWLKRADQALYAAKNNGRNCGYWNTGEALEPIADLGIETGSDPEVQDAAAAAQLAVEAFADTTFVREVSRQIAEWRRGGSTFSVALLRRCGGEKPGWVEPEKVQQVGNRALLQVGRQCVRDMDLVTRWLGDGLAILLPAATATDARRVARRILDALSRIECSVDELPEMAVSIGIAEGIEGNDANRVLQRAWMALAAAREAGKGTMFVHDGVRTVSATPRQTSR